MREKLTNRIGIISFFLYTILFFVQIIGGICNVNIVVQIVIFVVYNICIATIMIICLQTDKKARKLLKILVAMIIADILVIVVCLIIYGIKSII